MSSGEKDSLETLKQIEIFDELVNEMRFEKNKSSEGFDLNNLTQDHKGKSSPKYFICFKGPLKIYNDTKNGRISLQKEESNLGVHKILKGNAVHRSEDQISAIKNIKKLYNEREKVILNFIMIILTWYLRLNTNQFIEKGAKYKILNKCFKDYQQHLHK